MKHAIVAALSAVLTKPQVTRLGGERLVGTLGRIYRTLWLVAHPRTYLEVAHAFASPQLRRLLLKQPRLMFKYVDEYLTTDLTRKERAAILRHHYEFLNHRAGEDFFDRIFGRRLELWQRTVDANVYRISMSFARLPRGEGDLALIFEANGVDLYTLSFTLGPGCISGLSDPTTIYIARLQGTVSRFDQIREATKACSDVSPAMLLLSAAEGIALALGLEHMIGIGASAHIAAKSPESFIKAYDEFWKAVGGVRLERNMYSLTVPMPGKPIVEIKRDHRSRTNRKRRFRRAVKEQVGQAFRDALHPPIRARSEATIGISPDRN